MNLIDDNSNEEFNKLMIRIQKQLPNLDRCLNILNEDNDLHYEQFKQKCIRHGYNFHRCLFHVDVVLSRCVLVHSVLVGMLYSVKTVLFLTISLN